jgi:hypothetical protein
VKKRLFIFAVLAVQLLFRRGVGLESLCAKFRNDEGYSYYEYLVSENGYAEIVRLTSGRSIFEIAEKLRVRVIKTERFFDTEILFGYVVGLNGFYVLDGRLINVQIADNGDFILIGSPYIPDGF